MILHITNGDAFNEHLRTEVSETALPFREAMMDGDTEKEIFSEAFIRQRAAALEVSEEAYKEKAVVYEALKNDADRYEELHLWFGRDTFCQMNLLTLLAFLEQIGYAGGIVLHTIDDESFAVLGETRVLLGGYRGLYEKILIDKCHGNTHGVICREAVALYFDYHAEDGALARLVRENREKSELSLLMLLLDASAAYGLSDLQAKKLIEKYR